jgi:hypothetical protein
MTEADWLNSTDPQAMLEFLRGSGSASARKLRLFAAACSRRVWGLLDRFGRGAVEMAELYADGLAGPEELRAARLACRFAGSQAAWYAAATNPAVAARNAALSAQDGVRAGRDDLLAQAECLVQAHLLRDVVGNPFQPLPPIDPGWLVGNNGGVKRQAEAIDEDRRSPEGELDNARLAALADALEEAGCENQAILGHCREQGVVHVRACHILDTLLGKV